MRAVPLERLRAKDELHARLGVAGVEPDTRQDGWPLAFATFAIVDHQFSEPVRRLCLQMQNYFVHLAPNMKYSSALRGITYSPRTFGAHAVKEAVGGFSQTV